MRPLVAQGSVWAPRPLPSPCASGHSVPIHGNLSKALGLDAGPSSRVCSGRLLNLSEL